MLHHITKKPADGGQKQVAMLFITQENEADENILPACVLSSTRASLAK